MVSFIITNHRKGVGKMYDITQNVNVHNNYFDSLDDDLSKDLIAVIENYFDDAAREKIIPVVGNLEGSSLYSYHLMRGVDTRIPANRRLLAELYKEHNNNEDRVMDTIIYTIFDFVNEIATTLLRHDDLFTKYCKDTIDKYRRSGFYYDEPFSEDFHPSEIMGELFDEATVESFEESCAEAEFLLSMYLSIHPVFCCVYATEDENAILINQPQMGCW